MFDTGEGRGSCAKFSPDFPHQRHSFLPAESETNASAPRVLSLSRSFVAVKEEGYTGNRGKLANKPMPAPSAGAAMYQLPPAAFITNK